MIRVVESGRSIVLGSGMRAHRAAGGVKVDRSGVVNRRVQGTRGSAGEGHSHEGEEEENA